MSRTSTTGATSQTPKAASSAQTTSKPTAATQAGLPLDKVAKRAYEKWIQSGCKDGCDMQHWLEAEAELKAEMKNAGQTRR